MTTSAQSKPLKKTTQITESLRQLVQEVGPDTKLPTYLELLGTLSVSRTTLNAALDELESQRVIYRRHGVGIFTAPLKRSQSVALLCNPRYFQGKNHSPFWDVLLEGARERALMDSFSCEVHFCKFDDYDVLPFSDNLLNSLQMGHLQGVIGVGMNRAAARWLKERGIHYTGFGGPAAWHVGIDSSYLIQLGVNALAQQGCQRIACLSPVLPFKPYPAVFAEMEPKIEVFRSALAHHNLPFVRERVAMRMDLLPQDTICTSLSHQEQGYHAIQQIFSTGAEAPDGLLFTDDGMAKGGLAALRELGLRFGHEVQVATHINRGTTVLSPYEDSVIRLEVDPAEVVDTLFSTLRDLMDGQQPLGYVQSPMGTEMDKQVRPVLHQPLLH